MPFILEVLFRVFISVFVAIYGMVSYFQYKDDKFNHPEGVVDLFASAFVLILMSLL